MTEKELIESHAGLQGEWFNYRKFYKKIAANKSFHRFIEIGVWKGHSTTYLINLLRNRHNLEMYAVDLFGATYGSYATRFPEDTPHLRKMFDYNLDKANAKHLVKVIEGCSWEVAERFEDEYFDFIHIDACHLYEAVKKDIKAWLPKIKKTGIFSGHDYNDPEVKKAVHEFFPANVINSKGPSWFIYGNVK